MTKETQRLAINGELTADAKTALVGVLGEVLARNRAAVRAVLKTRRLLSESHAVTLTQAEVAEADRVAPAYREMIRGLLSDFNTGRTEVVIRRGDAPDVNETQARHIS